MQLCTDITSAVQKTFEEAYKEPIEFLLGAAIFSVGAFASGILLSSGSWSRCLVNAVGISVLNTACFNSTENYTGADNQSLSNLVKICACTALSSTLLMALSAYATGYPSLSSLPRVIKQVAFANLGLFALCYVDHGKN